MPPKASSSSQGEKPNLKGWTTIGLPDNELVIPYSLDTHVTNRRDYTKRLCMPKVGQSSAENWIMLVMALRGLVQELAEHAEMAANLDQTFNTPANNKSNHFAWDFAQRTLFQAYLVPRELPENKKSQWQDLWEETCGRATMIADLCLDTKKGALSKLTEQSYPGQKGKHKPMGKEVEANANFLKGVALGVMMGMQVMTEEFRSGMMQNMAPESERYDKNAYPK